MHHFKFRIPTALGLNYGIIEKIQEPSRYFANPTNAHKKCHFMVDVDYGVETEQEPLYHLNENHWDQVFEAPVLNPVGSHWFHRAFYIPPLHEKNVKYGKYRLLKNKELKVQGLEKSQV